MFERYTERARRVIFFARYEASEFSSPYIETEFLLLGLLREDKYVVVRWLGDGDWQTILREEVAKRVFSSTRIPTSVDLPLSGESKQVLGFAAEEAERLGHRTIGTEHLFLGLLRDPGSRTAKILTDRGVNASTIRETLAKEGTEAPGRLGAIARASFPMEILSEDGETLFDAGWPLPHVPAVGETIRLNLNQGPAGTYEVMKVEWEVAPLDPPQMSKVILRMRRAAKTP